LQLKLSDIALAISVESAERIHDVEILASLIQVILLVLYDLQRVQDVSQQTVERRVLLLLLFKVDTEVVPNRFELALIVSEPLGCGI
jgi:hypothetical protein